MHAFWLIPGSYFYMLQKTAAGKAASWRVGRKTPYLWRSGLAVFRAWDITDPEPVYLYGSVSASILLLSY